MKTLIFLILLSISQNLFGQVYVQIEKVLDYRSIKVLQKFCDTVKVDQSEYEKIGVSFSLDIASDFKKYTFYIKRSIPMESRTRRIFTFRANIIAKNDTIIFLDFGEKKNKKVDNGWEEFYNSIKKFQNDSLMSKLDFLFKESYGGVLNVDELFGGSQIFYGEMCALSYQNPKERVSIKEWVKDNNKANLLIWLGSSNIEKQIYAIDGLYQLKQKGVELSNQETLYIKNVLGRNGQVKVCNGCMYGSDGIKDIAPKFNF
jgi:hypothetical protein